jgi:hypothetical protein
MIVDWQEFDIVSLATLSRTTDAGDPCTSPPNWGRLLQESYSFPNLSNLTS